ncbi:MAG: hypothetical protein HY074_11285 [Deltaproteobacteria bacterium]|nr:hypothetical protein [Deltaproteobacteria bacterium]
MKRPLQAIRSPATDLLAVPGAAIILVAMDALIENSIRVEIYRVRDGAAASGPFRNLVVLRQGPDLSVRQHSSIKRLLLDPGTFASRQGEGVFDSGILFRFYSGEDVGDVAVCFVSGEVDFVHHTATTSAASESGAASLTADAFAELIRFARKVFPNDSELETLHPS